MFKQKLCIVFRKVFAFFPIKNLLIISLPPFKITFFGKIIVTPKGVGRKFFRGATEKIPTIIKTTEKQHYLASSRARETEQKTEK